MRSMSSGVGGCDGIGMLWFEIVGEARVLFLPGRPGVVVPRLRRLHPHRQHSFVQPQALPGNRDESGAGRAQG